MTSPLAICCRHAFVRGRVQGVAYRWSAADRARELGITGWVRNLSDGRVEAWLEGCSADVEAMLAWMRIGPPAARTDELQVTESEPKGATAFEILKTAHG